jgi:hypothetical protein
MNYERFLKFKDQPQRHRGTEKIKVKKLRVFLCVLRAFVVKIFYA